MLLSDYCSLRTLLLKKTFEDFDIGDVCCVKMSYTENSFLFYSSPSI
jgi:hypothetical protein